MEDIETTKSAKTHKKGDWRRHCKGLDKKPISITKKDLKKLREEANEAIKDFDAVATAMEKVKNEIIDAAIKKGSIQAAKMLARKPLQAALGPLGWAWAAYDVFDGIQTIDELTEYLDDVKKVANQLKELPNKMKELDAMITDFDGEGASKLMADLQSGLAVVNPCIRMRKCMLGTYSQSQSKTEKNQACCKGQTGHHLIPDVYMFGQKDGKKNKNDKRCSKYTTDTAPVVCAEGTTQYSGSHGKMHTELENALEGKDNFTPLSEDSIDYEVARDSSIEAHKKTFPLSACSEKCLKAQLDNYYKKKCPEDSNPTLTYTRIVEPDTRQED